MSNRVNTIEEAFTFAFKEELRFRELYNKLYTIAEDETTKELFRELSAMEDGHVEKLKLMYRKNFDGKEPVLETVSTPGNVAGAGELTVRSGLEFAIIREEYAADHYYMMADMIDDAEVFNLLNELAHEEENHATLLENKLEMLN